MTPEIVEQTFGGEAVVRTVAPSFELGVFVPREFGSPLQRAKERFLSPVKTGSQIALPSISPGSKPGATVLTPATLTESYVPPSIPI